MLTIKTVSHTIEAKRIINSINKTTKQNIKQSYAIVVFLLSWEIFTLNNDGNTPSSYTSKDIFPFDFTKIQTFLIISVCLILRAGTDLSDYSTMQPSVFLPVWYQKAFIYFQLIFRRCFNINSPMKKYFWVLMLRSCFLICLHLPDRINSPLA
jgi:hypothetical protein